MMEEELESNPDYANIELVDTVYGDDDDQKSFDKTEALLQNHPDLKGIISPTTVGIAAAARYLSDSRVQGQGRADRSGHPEPDARVRRGRHRRGLRAVEPGRPRLPGDLRHAGAGQRRHHRRGGRHLRGRQRSASSRSAPTASCCWASRSRSTPTTSTTSTSESSALPSGPAASGRRRRPATTRPTTPEETAMQRVLLPAPGQARADGGVRRAARRGVAGDARRARAGPAGTTTRCSCATTACSSATSRRRRPATPPRPAWRPPR